MDINKPAKQLIIEDINVLNNTALLYTDFEFGAPTPATVLSNPNINTSITITPNQTSPYYNSIDWKYHRMDIGSILSTQAVGLLPGSAQYLSELLPQINTMFGINLTMDDVEETLIPIIDPLHPEITQNLIIQCKLGSLLFTGSGSITLGAHFYPVPDANDGKARYLYVTSTGYGVNSTEATIDCVKINGEPLESWQYFKNATALTSSVITSSFLTTAGVVVNGSFTFRARLTGDATEFDYNANCVLLNPVTGYVLNAWSHEGFIASSTVTGQHLNNAVYKVDAVDKIIKFNPVGDKEVTYTPTISYVPELIHVDNIGRVYCVTPEFSASASWHGGLTAKQRRIDRLLPDGTIDFDFNPVTIGASVSVADSFRVLSISSISDANPSSHVGVGFYINLNTTNNSSTASVVPVVNGKPFVPTGVSTQYAYNGVIKLLDNGLTDPLYQTEIPSVHPTAVIKQPFTFPIGEQSIAASSAGVLFLTNKDNPVTGFTHRQPIGFNAKGEPNLLSGFQYYDSYRWTRIDKVKDLTNGMMLVTGTYIQRLPSGLWTTDTLAACLYNRYGVPVQPIWRQAIASLTPAVVINIMQREEVITP